MQNLMRLMAARFSEESLVYFLNVGAFMGLSERSAFVCAVKCLGSFRADIGKVANIEIGRAHV